MKLIARKTVGRVKAGESFRAEGSVARALVALKMADYAPKAIKVAPVAVKTTLTAPKRQYLRRDMKAED
jgi:hypothetical protein